VGAPVVSAALGGREAEGQFFQARQLPAVSDGVHHCVSVDGHDSEHIGGDRYADQAGVAVHNGRFHCRLSVLDLGVLWRHHDFAGGGPHRGVASDGGGRSAGVADRIAGRAGLLGAGPHDSLGGRHFAVHPESEEFEEVSAVESGVSNSVSLSKEILGVQNLKISFLSYSDEEPGPDGDGPNNQNPAIHITSDTLSATRVLCGGLFLPTIATIVGRLFFDSIKNNVQRTLVGGIAFVAVKGILKIYFKQKQHVRKQQRKILDYTDENVWKYSVPLPAASSSRPPAFEDNY
jgi:hypothetical protein